MDATGATRLEGAGPGWAAPSGALTSPLQDLEQLVDLLDRNDPIRPRVFVGKRPAQTAQIHGRPPVAPTLEQQGHRLPHVARHLVNGTPR